MTDLQQQRLNEYLDHMIQAIEQVGDYLNDVTEAHFLSTRLLQDGVGRNLALFMVTQASTTSSCGKLRTKICWGCMRN